MTRGWTGVILVCIRKGHGCNFCNNRQANKGSTKQLFNKICKMETLGMKPKDSGENVWFPYPFSFLKLVVYIFDWIKESKHANRLRGDRPGRKVYPALSWPLIEHPFLLGTKQDSSVIRVLKEEKRRKFPF